MGLLSKSVRLIRWPFRLIYFVGGMCVSGVFSSRLSFAIAIVWMLLLSRLVWSHNLWLDVTLTISILGASFCTVGVSLMRHSSAEWSSFFYSLAEETGEEDEVGTPEEAHEWQTTIKNAKNARLSTTAKMYLAFVVAPAIVLVACTTAAIVFGSKALSRAEWPADVSAVPGPHIALALSGGGYRAAVLHAGVLDELKAMHVRVTNVSTVSGGSIIGAYYVAGGDPKAFADAVARGRFKLRPELVDLHNLFRLPFPGFTRTHVQANLVDRVLLGGLRFQEVRSTAPLLMLCATDIVTGQGAGISADGVLYSPVTTLAASGIGNLRTVSNRSRFVGPDKKSFPCHERLASLVAASGAFPGALPALTFQHQNRMLKLADGGIFDNSGVSLLIERHRLSQTAQNGNQRNWKLDLILASDAGAPFREDFNGSFLAEFGRVIDIIYANSAAVALTKIAEGVPIIRFSPAELAKQVQSSNQAVENMTRYRGASAEVVRSEIIAGLNAFKKTATLEDDPGAKAGDLYQLGRYLVWSRWPEIQPAISKIVSHSH